MLRTRVMLITFVLATIFSALLIYIINSHDSNGDIPNDAAIRDRFRDQQPKFEALRDLIARDAHVVAIGEDYICLQGDKLRRGESYWLRHGKWISIDERTRISEEELLSRWVIDEEDVRKLRELLDVVGAERVARDPVWLGTGFVSITMGSIGNVVNSTTKSIVYCQDGLPEGSVVVESTDNIADESDWFAPLGDGWWIYCSRS